MGRKKPTARDEESGLAVAGAVAGAGAGGKSKKKGFLIGDDEYSIGAELSEDVVVNEEKVAVAPFGNKKKGKKGGSKKIGLKDEDEEEEYGIGEVEDEDEEADTVIKVSGKKKSKGKKSGSASVFSSSSFGLLRGDDEEEDDDNGDDDERKNDTEKHEEQDSSVVEFYGKKKPSKSKKSGGSKPSAFDLLDIEEEEDNKEKDESSKEEDDDIGITFTGKKKKKPKKSSENSFSVALLDKEDNRDDLGEGGDVDHDEQIPEVKFSGKKKSSIQKSIRVEAAVETGDVDVPTGFVEPDQPTDDSKVKKQTSDTVADTSKNKKKKKKGGKAGQEDDDLDKILAEIGGAPGISKDIPKHGASVVAPPEVKQENQPEVEETAADKDADEEGPAAGASKKKKKKDKEKEKKAAAAAPAVQKKTEEGKNEITNKLPSKKIPKHIREMQESLARLKEAEEKKKREEEERLKKEEEERCRLEELERLAEERKRLKKEREKEKIQKKKQEGKYLTQKEKIEVRKREQVRNRLVANGGITNLATDKKPVYHNKKSKPIPQSNGATASENVESTDPKETQQETLSEVDSVEAENADEAMSSTANENSNDTALIEENGVDEEEAEDDDDEEEWDAKSWDDADLKLPGITPFADEEIESEPEPEPLQKKEIKNARSVAQDAELPPIEAKVVGLTGKAPKVLPLRSDQVEAKNKDSEIVGTDENNNRTQVNLEKKNKNKVSAEEEIPKSNDVPVQNAHNLRSPICCIMGHVDTGKTKLLDCIRGTNVQEGEAGGITQQIGATYFPAENIRERTRELKADAKLNVPGLLVIDTPGHESFTNLRTRGSGLCDIAILVVDIMHGLEPQTIESLNLLKMRNTEFIVALNKVDRLYAWKTFRNAPIIKAMKQQSKDVQNEFNRRVTEVITQFKEQGLNTELYYKNKEMGETFSIVPTSAISGEGIPDMLLLLVQWAQKTMVKRLTYSDEVQCTVLEVKVIEGHGTTIDVVLVNGVLHEGDQIVVCGLQGPIVTTIRALLTPHPMKELRVKGTYLHHKEIKAAQGIKITGQGFDHAIAGTSLYVVGPDDDVEDAKEAAMEDMKSVMSRIDKSGEGVYVQASTLGSLEALLEFLKTPAVNIPVSGISIGPVHKKDVMKASVMLEKKKEYGTILAFDVKVTQEARELADEVGVKIFIADIIYHLFDQFKAYLDNLKEEKKKEAAEEAVFPCVLKIVPDCVFNKKDPIILGVDILEGIAKIGTPICVPQKEFIDIGRVASIENNHKAVDYAKKGQRVAIKIIGSNSEEQQKMFGRHFETEDELVSKISRNSLDALKEHYAGDLSTEDKHLLFKLKRLFKIP